MLLTEIAYKTEQCLNELKKKGNIINFKLSVELNLSIIAFLRINEEQEPQDFSILLKDINQYIVSIVFITDEKSKYMDLDSTKEPIIDYDNRRRLGGIIDTQDYSDNNPCPVFCFYSYKGGVGRTTTLAAFATYLATVEQKKVIVIDCDFEAPGIINYFDLDLDTDIREVESIDNGYETPYKSGIVEYFLDKKISKKQGITLNIAKDYLYEVGSEYSSGSGSIHLLAAGNIDHNTDENAGKSYREQYLEALARIDTYGRYGATTFHELFNDLKKAIGFDYENGVILIDSRTGFNDTFATISSVSDVIVGFFGNNLQTQAGLHQFLDMFGQLNAHQKRIILANSIITHKRHCETIFKENIRAYTQKDSDKFGESSPLPEAAFPVVRETETLPNIGVKQLETKINKDKDNPDRLVNQDFIDLVIQDKHYNGLFNDDKGLVSALNFLIDKKKSKKDQEQPFIEEIDDNVQTSRIAAIDNISDFLDAVKNKVSNLNTRKELLANLHNDKMLFPTNTYPYAEDLEPSEMQAENFFFRNCMRDIFNRDKIIISGYKGMGKTQLYQGLKSDVITKQLCKRAGKKHDDYLFINVLDVFSIKEDSKYFDCNAEFDIPNISNSDYFFNRFWQLLTYTKIIENTWITTKYKTEKIDIPEIRQNNGLYIKNFIQDEQKMQLIRDELNKIDSLLNSSHKQMIIAYDQLDYIVKPEYWTMSIAPLINFWRTNPYSNILPKIFVRTDLYERMTNITNKHQLSNKIVDLRWEKAEIFGLVFKIVFVHAKNEFYKLMYSYNEYSSKTKEKIIEIDGLLDETQQLVREDEEIMKYLVNSFFGASSNINDKTGQESTSYDWFFDNLSDAKGFLSIRPLLDLLKRAIKTAILPENIDREWKSKYKPVLSGLYFSNNDVKKEAVKQYYEDLAQDTVNKPLLIIKDYYDTHCLLRYKTYTIASQDLKTIFNDLIKKYKNNSNLNGINDFETLKNLLETNGIIKPMKITADHSKTIYEFPFMYRLFFGLTSHKKAIENDIKNRDTNIEKELKK